MWNKQSFYDCGRMRGIICKRRISLHIVEDISNNNTAEAFKRFAFSKVTLLQFVFKYLYLDQLKPRNSTAEPCVSVNFEAVPVVQCQSGDGSII